MTVFSFIEYIFTFTHPTRRLSNLHPGHEVCQHFDVGILILGEYFPSAEACHRNLKSLNGSKKNKKYFDLLDSKCESHCGSLVCVFFQHNPPNQWPQELATQWLSKWLHLFWNLFRYLGKEMQEVLSVTRYSLHLPVHPELRKTVWCTPDITSPSNVPQYFRMRTIFKRS